MLSYDRATIELNINKINATISEEINEEIKEINCKLHIIDYFQSKKLLPLKSTLIQGNDSILNYFGSFNDEQLQDKEKQLRNEKEQLRDEKLILLSKENQLRDDIKRLQKGKG